jgi:dTMP kinase
MTGLVTFEGGEGAGKSTQATRLVDALRAAGEPVVQVREPGGTPVGEGVRALLLDPDRGPTVNRAELLLYLAARAELCDTVIAPALARGEIVVCDRFIDASVAYQGGGRGLGPERVTGLNAFATSGLVPDVTFLLDIAPREGLARAAGRGRPDRIERESLAFHERVRAAYVSLARAERVVRLDATRAEGELHEEILRHTLARLGRS